MDVALMDLRLHNAKKKAVCMHVWFIFVQTSQFDKHLIDLLCLGFEVIVQVTISILLLLLNRTDTPTTGGLEAIFDEGKTWLGWDASAILAVSVTWSIFSTIKTHTNLTILEKGFCPTTSKLVVLAWATFATLRRILSLVAVFIPSLGLYSLLNHLKWDKVPFQIRYENAQSISPGDKISLLGLNETVLWSQLDRWDYTGGIPSPPKYNLYTFLNLQENFIYSEIAKNLTIVKKSNGYDKSFVFLVWALQP